ncbi:NAD(P)/FAD-dependent oxidoreductase [Elusimicrobiota bacterium]
MQSRADVVVIGGGIIGCSIAHYLASKGSKSVVVIEMDRIGAGETGRSAAMVMLQTRHEPIARLADLSIREYHGYESSFGADLSFRVTGSILYATSSEGASQLHAQVAMQRGMGLPIRLLDQDEIRNKAGILNCEDVLVAAYSPNDGYISPSAVIEFYRKHAVRRGAEFNEKVKATQVEVASTRVVGVRTTAGHIKADTVVNASGVMAGFVGRQVGIELPVQCNKRHIVVVKPQSPPGPFPILEDVATEWYFRPEGPNILIGVGPVMPVSLADDSRTFEQEPDAHAWEWVAQYVEQRAPSLLDAELLECWAGVRSLSSDNLPILGPVDGIAGFINCCGLSGFGISTAPACGKLVSELILDGKTSTMALDDFSLARFH